MDTTWITRVSSTEPGTTKVFVRTQRLLVGDPISFDSEYDGITSLELLLGALGADIAGGLQALAKRRRLEIDNVEVLVEGRLDNPLMWLDVVGEHGTTALAQAVVKVYIGTIEEDDAIEKLWQEILQKSPVIQTLNRSVELDFRMDIVI